MGAGSFNIFIIFMICLSNNFHQSHGSSEDRQVIQPQNQTVNSTLAASISCEHNANVTSVEDVRLNGLSPTGSTLLCQKGKQDCKNIFMQKVNPKKYHFILLNIGLEAMSMKYECEFSVVKDGIDYILKGAPTALLPGKEEAETCKPLPPQAPLPPQSHQLRWILIGLLALLFLYSSVMTSFYLRLRFSDRQPDNGTYVVMRKAPLPRNPAFDI